MAGTRAACVGVGTVQPSLERINCQNESGCRRGPKQRVLQQLQRERRTSRRERQVREDRATGGGVGSVCVIASLRRVPTCIRARDAFCSCPACIHLRLFRVLLSSFFASQRTHTLYLLRDHARPREPHRWSTLLPQLSFSLSLFSAMPGASQCFRAILWRTVLVFLLGFWVVTHVAASPMSRGFKVPIKRSASSSHNATAHTKTRQLVNIGLVVRALFHGSNRAQHPPIAARGIADDAGQVRHRCPISPGHRPQPRHPSRDRLPPLQRHILYPPTPQYLQLYLHYIPILTSCLPSAFRPALQPHQNARQHHGTH